MPSSVVLKIQREANLVRNKLIKFEMRKSGVVRKPTGTTGVWAKAH